MSETKTLKTAFNSTARWRPDNVAFVQALDPDNRLTYAEANDKARRLATGLDSLGIEKGDRVAILSGTSVEHAVTFYACMKLGAIPATLHTMETADRLQWMIDHIGAAALLFQPQFSDLVSELRPGVEDPEHFIGYGDESAVPDDAVAVRSLLRDAPAEEPSTDVTPSDPALINFTSGSTGRPKAIVHSHENCIEAAHLGGQLMYGSLPGDVYLNAFTPSFIAWANATLPLVNLGGTMVFLDEWAPSEIPALVEREGISILWFIPTHWKQILEADIDAYDLQSVRRVGYGGEPMSPALYRRLSDAFGTEIATVYGSTETLTSGTVLLPEETNPETVDSVGKPMPNVELRIVEPGTGDPTAEVERGETGEVLVRAPTVATGVWDEPDREESLLHEEGWWISGDLGYVGDDGNLRLEGRVDNMIISGGINIHAESVEQILEEHDAIQSCAIVPTAHEKWGQTLQAYVRTDRDVAADDIDDWCRANPELGNYRRPRSYVFVEEFPTTATGKIDRAALEARDDSET